MECLLWGFRSLKYVFTYNLSVMVSFSATENTLYWTETYLDKIESILLDDPTHRVTEISVRDGSDLDIHPFSVAYYFEILYFTDRNLNRIVEANDATGDVSFLDKILQTPTEMHIYAGISD